MKWLLLLFSIFKPFFFQDDKQTINPIAEIKAMIKENAMKVVSVFAVANALAFLFAAGLIITALDMGAQYDQSGYVYFSSIIGIGIGLMVVSVLTGVIIVRSFTDKDDEKSEPTLSAVGTVHPLQDALALLVADFVKEREFKRTQEQDKSVVRNSTDPKVPTEDFVH